MVDLGHHAQHTHSHRAIARAVAASSAKNLAEFFGIDGELVEDALALAAGCTGRGLWPEACAVNVGNWHESQVLTRALPAAGPASTISKQWQAGHENAQVPQPMHVSACSFQKGSSKCVVTNARTACASNFFSGPAIALPVRSDFSVLPLEQRAALLRDAPHFVLSVSQFKQDGVRATLRAGIKLPRTCRSSFHRARCRPA